MAGYYEEASYDRLFVPGRCGLLGTISDIHPLSTQTYEMIGRYPPQKLVTMAEWGANLVASIKLCSLDGCETNFDGWVDICNFLNSFHLWPHHVAFYHLVMFIFTIVTTVRGSIKLFIKRICYFAGLGKNMMVTIWAITPIYLKVPKWPLNISLYINVMALLFRVHIEGSYTYCV